MSDNDKISDNDDEFKPNSTLREIPLKRILKTYIVSNVVDKYLTAGIRVLWKEKDFSDMFEKRSKLETVLKEIKQIVFYVNCVTALKETGDEIKAGFAFWIVYDWPESTLEKFENMVCKKFIEVGVKIASCIDLFYQYANWTFIQLLIRNIDLFFW